MSIDLGLFGLFSLRLYLAAEKASIRSMGAAFIN